MSTFGYARENVGRALVELAESEGTLKERVERAAVQLLFAPSTDLPPDLKASFDSLCSLVSQNGSVDQSVSAMTDDEAVRFASELVALHGEMWFETGKSDL